MTTCKVAAVQMVSGAAVEGNLVAAARGIAEAADQGAQLVALPEYFCLMGRGDRDKVAIREAFGEGEIQSFLAEAARRHGIWLVGGTAPLVARTPDKVRNASLVFDPEGHCVARYDKIHLFGFDSGQEHYAEAQTIEAGDAPCRVDTPCGGMGVAICYDLRFPELFRALGDVNLIVVPAAFTYTTGRAHWELLLRARAVENQCYVLASAQGGQHENGRRTWGHSMLIDPWGDVVSCLPEGEGVVSGLVDPARIAQVRTSLPALKHRVM